MTVLVFTIKESITKTTSKLTISCVKKVLEPSDIELRVRMWRLKNICFVFKVLIKCDGD